MHRLKELIANTIWIMDYPIRFAGCRFNARMTVLRLSDSRLLIHSSGPIDAMTKTEIESLGSVSYIIAAGNYHYLYVSFVREAFPDAEIQICPGEEKKDSSLGSFLQIQDSEQYAWSSDLEHVVIPGAALIQEVADLG